VVVIDAGHGGFDRGGIPRQLVPEKTMNLDVAQRLEAVLTAYGYRVVMTRDSDVFVHWGLASRSPTLIGTRSSFAFTSTPHLAAARAASRLTFTVRQSLPLASAIHYYVAGGAPTANRGVRRRAFTSYEERRSRRCWWNAGFLTNAAEANYVQSADYRQKLAEEIGRGVRERSLVASTSAANRLAANNTGVPLQPFIDQTHYRDPDLSRSKRAKRSSEFVSIDIVEAQAFFRFRFGEKDDKKEIGPADQRRFNNRRAPRRDSLRSPRFAPASHAIETFVGSAGPISFLSSFSPNLNRKNACASTMSIETNSWSFF